MDKETFCWILQCSLLAFDEMTKQEMVEIGASERDAEAGIKLCNYLKSIKTDKPL